MSARLALPLISTLSLAAALPTTRKGLQPSLVHGQVLDAYHYDDTGIGTGFGSMGTLSPPPPSPPLCTGGDCTWDGPRSLVYVAPMSPAAFQMATVLGYVHRMMGMPYAWQGAHSNWRTEAAARGFECSKTTGDAYVHLNEDDSTSCICFAEYLFAYNLTANGLWVCPGAVGPTYTSMVERVMPGATWLASVPEPWANVQYAYLTFQQPSINTSKTLLATGACDYGYGYVDRLGFNCFVAKMADPALRRCSPKNDEVFSASPLCSLSFSSMARADELAARYTLLPEEDPVTPLLAALQLDMNTSAEAVERLRDVLEVEVYNGGTLGLMPSTNRTIIDYTTAGCTADEAEGLREAYLRSGVEAFLLHRHAQESAAALRRRFSEARSVASLRMTWDDLFTVPTAAALPSETPHAAADRLTTFDNANIKMSDLRMDVCTPGLPSALGRISNFVPGQAANTSAQAQALMVPWMKAARAHSPNTCWTSTGWVPDLDQPHIGDSIVVPEWQFAFQTAAKVASQSVEAFATCRFDFEQEAHEQHNFVAQSDFVRATMVRDPKKRVFASVGQTSSHYLSLLKVPPSLLEQCLAGWPTDNTGARTDIKSDPRLWAGTLPNFPPECTQAWTTDVTNEHIASNLNGQHPVWGYDEVRAVQGSKLYNLLWSPEVKPACRAIASVGRTHMRTFFCEGPECDEPCNLSDELLANIISAAVSDAAKSTVIGCGQQLLFNEHMWPQFLHTAIAGRVDMAIRLENVREDSDRLEQAIADHAGRTLPPRGQTAMRSGRGIVGKNCSIADIPVNADTDLNSILDNHTHMQLAIARSPDLQQRLCAYYWHDFVCGGYDLYQACAAPPETWLDSAVERLMTAAPLQMGPAVDLPPSPPPVWKNFDSPPPPCSTPPVPPHPPSAPPHPPFSPGHIMASPPPPPSPLPPGLSKYGDTYYNNGPYLHHWHEYPNAVVPNGTGTP